MLRLRRTPRPLLRLPAWAKQQNSQTHKVALSHAKKPEKPAPADVPPSALLVLR